MTEGVPLTIRRFDAFAPCGVGPPGGSDRAGSRVLAFAASSAPSGAPGTGQDEGHAPLSSRLPHFSATAPSLAQASSKRLVFSCATGFFLSVPPSSAAHYAAAQSCLGWSSSQLIRL